MRNEVFPFPRIYPVLSFVCWLFLLIAYLVPHARSVLGTRPFAGRWGPRSTALLHRLLIAHTTFAGLGFWRLFSLLLTNPTLYMSHCFHECWFDFSILFYFFIWFFKKMPKPQAQRRQESKGWEECTKRGRCREWREKLRSKEEGEKGGGSKQWEVEGRRLPLTPSWVLGEPGPGLRLHPGSQLPGLPAGYSPQVKQVPSDQKWASGGLF